MTPITQSTARGRPLLAYETVEAFRFGGLTLAHNRNAVRTLLTAEPLKIDSFVTGATGLTMLATTRLYEAAYSSLCHHA